jgi:hypothetical protein
MAARDSTASPHRRRRRVNTGEVEAETDQGSPAPVREAEVKVWGDVAYLVANPARESRRARIIEDYALPAVEDARSTIHFGGDCVDSERRYAIDERAPRGVKRLALPSEETRGPRDDSIISGPGRHDCNTARPTVRYRTRETRCVQVLELLPAHREQPFLVERYHKGTRG